MNDAGTDGFFDQIDQWSTEIWRRHPWLKGLEGGIESNVLNSEKFIVIGWSTFSRLWEYRLARGTRHAELKSLFHLINNLNPYYFRSDEIR